MMAAANDPANPQHGSSGRASRGRYVSGAVELIERDGYGSLTARKLAIHLGVAPSALYAHFADMDDLLDAAADECVTRLIAALVPPQTVRPTSVADLVTVVAGYASWLAQRPHVFDLLFTRQRSTNADYSRVEAHWGPTFAGLVAAGTLAADRVNAVATVIIWAVHGRLLLGRTYGALLPESAIADDVSRIIEGVILGAQDRRVTRPRLEGA